MNGERKDFLSVMPPANAGVRDSGNQSTPSARHFAGLGGNAEMRARIFPLDIFSER
jgi:hypothetical protein